MLKIDCVARNQSQKLSVGMLGLLLFLNAHLSCPVACLLLRSEYSHGTLETEARSPGILQWSQCQHQQVPALCESLESKEAHTVLGPRFGRWVSSVTA